MNNRIISLVMVNLPANWVLLLQTVVKKLPWAMTSCNATVSRNKPRWINEKSHTNFS